MVISGQLCNTSLTPFLKLGSLSIDAVLMLVSMKKIADTVMLMPSCRFVILGRSYGLDVGEAYVISCVLSTSSLRGDAIGRSMFVVCSDRLRRDGVWILVLKSGFQASVCPCTRSVQRLLGARSM